MKAVDEAPSTGPCGVGDAVPAENSRAGIAEYLKKVLRGVRESPPDWFLEEIGVERDYVHLHRVIPPKYAVSRVVETLKSVTSRQL